jgi:hypothetical protein
MRLRNEIPGYLGVLAGAALCFACVQPKSTGEDPQGDDAGSPDDALVVTADNAAIDDAIAPDAPPLGADVSEPDRPADVGTTPADGPPAAPLEAGVAGAALGATCQRGGDCGSGFCVDGVCCNEACTGQCLSCAVAGSAGTCLPVTGAPRGQRPACQGSGACAGTCDGKDPSACHYPGASVSCGTPSCKDGVATPAATCDGQGACASPRPISCTPDPCDGDVCGQCSGTRPCANGYQCTSGKCLPLLDAGKSCLGDGQCKSQHCQQDVCCDRACTGDCEACNLPGTAGKCTFTAGKICRPSAGLCDVAEACDGQSSSCPADAKQPNGSTCRASAGLCDLAEACDGQSPLCPADVKQPSGSTCRPSTGLCDLPEVCDGQSSSCPADAKQPNGSTCRPAAGPCDVAETCNGQSATCPGDGKQPSSYTCRPAVGPCDVAETCDGQSVACGSDAKAVNGVECRPSTGLSDPAELCNGVAVSCPADVKYPNLVANGEFDNGLTSWSGPSNNAAIDTSSQLSGHNSIHYTVNAGDFFVLVQTVQGVQGGQAYQLAFRAKADKAIRISAILGGDSVDFDVTTSAAQFGPYPYVPGSGSPIMLQFQSADESLAEATQIWLDRIELY